MGTRILSLEDLEKQFVVDPLTNPNTPTTGLLDFLAEAGIVVPSYDNKFDGVDGVWNGPGGIVDLTQQHCQRFRPGTDIPCKRMEIDLPREDAHLPRAAQERQFQKLRRLGMFHHQFPTPPECTDCILWHSGHLTEMTVMCQRLFQFCQSSGFKPKEIFYLGPATAIGNAIPFDQLLRIFEDRKSYAHLLHDYSLGSDRWYCPESAVFAELWRALKKPAALQGIPLHPIAARDRDGGDGKPPIPANTVDTLLELASSGLLPTGQRLSVTTLTWVPAAIRQLLITRQFLERYYPDSEISVLCSHQAGPPSLFNTKRETANTIFEIRRPPYI